MLTIAIKNEIIYLMENDRLYGLLSMAAALIGILYAGTNEHFDLVTVALVISPVFLFGYFFGKITSKSKKK